MTLCRSLVLTVTLLPCLAGQAGAQGLPGVDRGADRRVVVDATQPPWRGIGRVQTELGGRCTGFLIAPQTVVTAAHCLFLRRPQRFVQPGSVHFLLGYAAGAFAGHAVATSYRLGPGYDPAHEADTAGADWALLTLAQKLGTADQVLRLAPTPTAPAVPAALGGYGQDRAEVVDADLHCRVLGPAADGQGRPLLRHDCAGTRGTSGAPLLAAGSWLVIGIQIEADMAGAGGVAVPIEALRQP